MAVDGIDLSRRDISMLRVRIGTRLSPITEAESSTCNVWGSSDALRVIFRTSRIAANASNNDDPTIRRSFGASREFRNPFETVCVPRPNRNGRTGHFRTGPDVKTKLSAAYFLLGSHLLVVVVVLVFVFVEESGAVPAFFSPSFSLFADDSSGKRAKNASR